MVTPTPDRSRNLLAIHALYHTDQIENSITILMEGENLWSCADFISARIDEFKDTRLSISDAKQFLALIRNREYEQSRIKKLIAAAVIGYLEAIDAVPSDEYNGLQYIYEPFFTTEYHVVDSLPSLEMFRDLPRRPGNFYLVLSWSDLQGQLNKHKIARQVSAVLVEEAYHQFQEFIDGLYDEECKRAGHIDKDAFITKLIPAVAEHAVEMLGEVKDEADFRVDRAPGRLICFLACWMLWSLQYREQITSPSLLTAGFRILFKEDQFLPVVMLDHGETTDITLH